jgi:hypothetical protein
VVRPFRGGGGGRKDGFVDGEGEATEGVGEGVEGDFRLEEALGEVVFLEERSVGPAEQDCSVQRRCAPLLRENKGKEGKRERWGTKSALFDHDKVERTDRI